MGIHDIENPPPREPEPVQNLKLTKHCNIFPYKDDVREPRGAGAQYQNIMGFVKKYKTFKEKRGDLNPPRLRRASTGSTMVRPPTRAFPPTRGYRCPNGQ